MGGFEMSIGLILVLIVGIFSWGAVTVRINPRWRLAI